MAEMTPAPRLNIARKIASAYVVQVATSNNSQPWVCSVYFVADEELNIYWLSLPSRRHSIELENNPNAAITMAIKTDQPVIGLSAEGTVGVIKNTEIVKEILPRYIEKYNSGKEFYERFIAGSNDHFLYRFRPNKYVLFDEVSYPAKGSIDIKVENT